jgi:hypothetical protein
MLTSHRKWLLTTGGLLAMWPTISTASAQDPAAPQGAAPVRATAASAPAEAGTPKASSIFLPAAAQPGAQPEVLPPATPTGPAPAPAAPAATPAAATPAAPGSPPGRPLTSLERCKYYNQACWLGFPEYFKGPPLGASVFQANQAQVANGDAARMTLYHYDFDPDGEHLTLRGRDRLVQIVATMPSNGFPLIIERTPANPALAEKRRLVVLNELAHGPFPVPDERVLIGIPLPNGLSGREAVLIYGNLLSQTASKGPTVLIGGFQSGGVTIGTATGGGGSAAAPPPP